MRTLEEIRRLASVDLTEDEVFLLPEDEQKVVRFVRERVAREKKCEESGGHERIATLDTRRGWHEGYCAKCGMNMNYDSGD